MYTHLITALYRHLIRIQHNFRRLWRNYLYQSLLAVLVITLVLWVLTVENAAVTASIGASAFIVFTMPKYITAQPRRIVGGHLIGLVTGSLVALIPHSIVLTSLLVSALAVGISIFLMLALNLEHPPASGTALGVAITGYSTPVAVAVITSSIILALVHRFLKKYLRNLV